MTWLVKNLKGIITAALVDYIILQTFVIAFMLPEIITSRVLSFINYGIYCIWFVFTLYSHILCIMSNPGTIPIGYCETALELRSLIDPLIPGDSNLNPSEVSRRKLAKEEAIRSILQKKCDSCICAQPPRTAHCMICGRCITRQIYHSTWVNNCVGYYTRRSFLQFAVYCSLFSLQSIVLFFFGIRVGALGWGNKLTYSILCKLPYICSVIISKALYWFSYSWIQNYERTI